MNLSVQLKGLMINTVRVKVWLSVHCSLFSPSSISLLDRFLSWGKSKSLIIFVAVVLSLCQLTLLKLCFITGESGFNFVQLSIEAEIFRAL